MSRHPWEPLARVGALKRWHAEIRAGKRRNVAADFDNLHAAACNELAALQCEAGGDRHGAEKFMDRALLRLHGCYQNPEDQEHALAERLLARLKADKSAPAVERPSGNPFAHLRPSPAPRWAAA